jgi:hypothetical protein
MRGGSVCVLHPIDETNPSALTQANQSSLGLERRVRREHDLRIERCNACRKPATVFALVGSTLDERRLVHNVIEQDGLDDELLWISRQRRDSPRRGQVGAGIEMKDLVTTRS